MLNHATLNTLKALKLDGMAQGLAEQWADPNYTALAFDERLGLLVDREQTLRENRRLSRLLQGARLKMQACLEDFSTGATRGLDRGQLAALSGCDWIRRSQNVIITGPTGVGKTYLACALAHQACRQGLAALYLRVPRLFENLRIAHQDGSYRKLLASLAKVDLLVLDDWALCPIGPVERNDLLEILDDRINTRATLLTSQLPVEHWHTYLGEPTLADAILDRVLHQAHRLALSGESRRQQTPPALT